ncbi:Uncharacterised protein (plasmid) [Legionella adelaidensis]|uniref:Uncharacterized protein n=1 Tax=Legionella adelaidensis TaxID=45056 RepID=A0A0W0R5G5_9GAMM|nr:hypothetical protein [Legionella adelaidensis]KTC66340.1 hypothetical protein Lade_0998 [Legionella adelaidensis]VEH84938.1 Uncharacterised protein [Legionella adelaidensis]
MTPIFIFFTWVRSKLTALSLWFYPLENDLPNDESGELIKRYLMHKSWFDKLTSSWVDKPIFEKLVYLVGAILLSALIGVVVGATTVLVLTTVALSLLIHGLFYTHEQHRHLGAKIFAAEELAAIEDLKASEQMFNNATSKLDAVVIELTDQPLILQEQAAKLDLERQKITTQNNALSIIVEAVETETTHLVDQQRAVNQEFSTISRHLQQYDHQITSSKDKLSAAEDAAVSFSSAVQELQQSQKEFSQAANRFCLFVEGQMVKREEGKSQATSLEETDFIDFLDREIADNDELINALKPVN